MSTIPQKTQRYVISLSLIALVLVAYLVMEHSVNDWMMVLVLGVLAAISETFYVKLPGVGAVTVAFAITFAAIILEGPLTAVIVSVLGIVLSRTHDDKRGYVHIFNTPIFKTAFNISQNTIYTAMSGLVYVNLHTRFITFGEVDPISVTLSMLTFGFFNTFLMTALIISLDGGKFFYTWYDNFRGTILNVLAVGLLGIIVAVSYNNYGPGAVVLFFIPLMLSRYSFKLYVDMRKNYYDTVKALINTIEAKDPYTSGHANRVGKYAVAIGTEINLSAKKIERLKNAALLHDIGKIGIDDHILNKQGRLTDLELEVIRNHPSIGYDIIKDIGFLKEVMDVVKHHHEKWDGTGYPDGLKKEEIPLETTVLTIADAFDAMTTDRPYREALSHNEAFEELRKNAGIQFNPHIIEKAILALSTHHAMDLE